MPDLTPTPPAAERLAEIRAEHDFVAHSDWSPLPRMSERGAACHAAVGDLLAELDRLTARVKSQQDELGSQEVQMLQLIAQSLEVQKAALKNLPE